MMDDQDLSLILDRWLSDGPTEMPDRVVDVVALGISRQRQRPAWRLDWRRYAMNTNIKIAAAIVAVVIVAVIGYNLLPGGSTGVGGPAPTPSASPSAVATPTASPTELSSFTFTPRVTVQAPAGWTVDGDGLRSIGLKPPVATSGPGAGSILVMSGPFVGANDRDCENRPAAGVGSSAVDVLAALADDPRIVTTAPGTATVGGRTGQVVDIKVAADWTGTCSWSEGNPAVLLVMATDQGPAFGTAGAETARVILLDIESKAVAIIISPAAGDTGTGSIDQAMPIVQAIQFTP